MGVFERAKTETKYLTDCWTMGYEAYRCDLKMVKHEESGDWLWAVGGFAFDAGQIRDIAAFLDRGPLLLVESDVEVEL